MTNICFQSGICCKIFYINISKQEYKSGKYKTQFVKHGKIQDWKLAKSSGANILEKKKDGSCIYLKNNKCSIYENRPKVCHGFFCMSKAKKYKNMVNEVKRRACKQKDLIQLPAVLVKI